MDLHRCLSVGGRAEDLALLGGNGGVAFDDPGGYPAQGLDAERQRGDVEEQDVLELARQNAGLDRGAQGHDLVGVDPAMGFAPEDFACDLLNQGHPRLPSDQDDLVQLARIDLRVLEGVEARLPGSLDQIVHQLFEPGPGELHYQVLRAGRVRSDEGKVDLAGLRGGEFALGPLGSLLEPLKGHRIPGEIDSLLRFKLLDQPVYDLQVEVVTAQVGVAVCRADLEDPIGDLEDGNVERSSAEVEHRDGLVHALLVETVGQGSRGRLVHYPENLETRYPAGILRGLPLAVVEVCRHRHHGLGDLLAEVVLGCLTHLLQDHRGDLGRRVPPALDLDHRVAVRTLDDLVGNPGLLGVDFAELPSHEPLDREHRVDRVGYGLSAGDHPRVTLPRVCECDNGGGRPEAFGVGDDDRLAALENGDAGVRRSQIYSYHLSHSNLPFGNHRVQAAAQQRRRPIKNPVRPALSSPARRRQPAAGRFPEARSRVRR